MKETICLLKGSIYLVIVFFLAACSHPVEETWLDKKSPKPHGTSLLNCEVCHDLTIECNNCHFGSSGSKTPSDWVHGMTPHDQLQADGEVCNTCHDLNRSYGNGPPACHDCHVPLGFHVAGESWLNKTNPAFHGTSTLSCADCHDLSTRCADCHFGASGSKTPSDWVHGMTSHDQLLADMEVCNTCHELNRGYGNGPPACHDCHGLPSSHLTGDAWINKESPAFHGTSMLNCADCHDLSLDCNACHFGSSGSTSPSEWIHGTTPHDQLEADGAVCNSCHTLNRGYGNGPGSCHDCHGLPDAHVTGETWINKESPDFHGASTLNCADCHDLLLECADCHFGSSGSKTPSDWDHGTTPHEELEADGAVCNSCHDLNRGYGNGPESCHDCHELENSHAVPFSDHAFQASSDPASCQECHGADLNGGSGPACSECHMADSPLTALNCTSCHYAPPAGTVYPNTDGGHTAHNLLPGVTGSCTLCHQGAGTQTAQHNNAAVEVTVSGYDASSGTASYDAGSETCSKVSCHGGKNTPKWFSGSIDVNTECGVCHSSGGEYNSYVSGKHDKHVRGEGHPCTECHDTSKLQAVHFNDLGTPEMNEAAQTIRDDLNYNGQSCLFTCHFGNDDKQHDAAKKW